MWLFATIYILAYGAMNGLLVWKLHVAWPRAGWLLPVSASFAALMVAAPILVRALERSGHIELAKVCAWVGYTWFALIFWFFVLALAGEAWNLGVRAVALLRPSASAWTLPPRTALAVYGVLIALAAIWGTREAYAVRIRRVSAPVACWPADAAPIRIAQITDVHLSPTLGAGSLREIVRLVEETKPDVFVCTGDMLDATDDQSLALAGMLARVSAPLGKFAILGNHEFYAGLPHSIQFLEACGFRILRGESANAGDHLLIPGVDDAVRSFPGVEVRTDENAALPTTRDGRAVLLLKHRPVIAPAARGRFDLQLSGHTHGGQIFPFGPIIRALVFRFWPGLHELDGGGYLYLSRGTGTWGPRMRLGAPPEVTLITLEPSSPH